MAVSMAADAQTVARRDETCLEDNVITRVLRLDESELERLRPVWNDTLTRCPDATIFQTWEWQRAWIRRFGGRSVVILLADGYNAPISLTPLTFRRYAAPGLSELTFTGVGVSDYLDITSAYEKQTEAATAVLDYLEASYTYWDFVDLHQIPQNGAATRIAELAERHGLLIETLDHEVCPVVDLPDSWEEYRKSLGKSLRFNIGYYERSLRKSYTVEIGLADTGNLEAEMDALFRLHALRWRRRWLPGALSVSKIQDFHREVARAFLNRGWLRLYYLKLDGVTHASLYCFAYGDRVYYYLGGFEPELAKYGLGTILTGHAIREAIEGGFGKFDLLRGAEDYKLRWMPELTRNSRIFITKPSVKSKLARTLHGIERRAEHVFKERIMKIKAG